MADGKQILNEAEYNPGTGPKSMGYHIKTDHETHPAWERNLNPQNANATI